MNQILGFTKMSVQTLKPEWIDHRSAAPGVVAIQESPLPENGRPVISYADAARRAVPPVVHIYTSQEVQVRPPFLNDPLFRHFFGDRFGDQAQRQSGLGSGVIVSAEGYILTNNHVVEQADEIEVALNDGRKLKAKIVGTDPESDLAVLRINAQVKLPTITFAPPESLQIGDVVLAIGNPFGVGQTVTSGIVSALGRTHLGINTFENKSRDIGSRPLLAGNSSIAKPNRGAPIAEVCSHVHAECDVRK